MPDMCGQQTMTQLISASDLVISFGRRTILDGVSLTLNKGEIVTLIGPNGSGKSSLARALMGAIPIARGYIKPAENLAVGYVPQKLGLDIPMPMSVRRFLAMPARADASAITTAARRAGADELLDRQVAALSGGQLQKVLLARAILGRPDILILDEPAQGMDQPATAEFYRFLQDYRAETGCGILLVSHDLHVVMSASDRVICLNGHICCEGTPQVVQEAPEYRALFGPGTGGTMALYRHEHDHSHDHGAGGDHEHTH